MSIFLPADILLPKVKSMEKWSVIACDQFSAQPEYWQRVKQAVAEEPSTFHLILPEAELGAADEEVRVEKIHQTMRQYLAEDLFELYPNSFVYVERTLENGMIRKGLIGRIDLEAYEYTEGAASPVRCTEKTVVERIPPRMKVRWEAALELPHVLLLCDDDEHLLIEPVTEKKGELPALYDFNLMEGGGRIRGWLVQGEESRKFEERLVKFAEKAQDKYADLKGEPVIFAVGDGNHSLATAKACYERLKAEHPGEDMSKHPARYALVELENLHDEAQVFEPIHRVIMEAKPEELLKKLEKAVCCENGGYPVTWYMGEETGRLYLDQQKGELAVGILQNFLDEYLKSHEGKIDYIHGDAELKELAKQERAIGFMLPAMQKSQLFRGVIADGALPRKTFSMGNAREKRYYLEARKISNDLL